MKVSAIFYVVVTSILLVTVGVMVFYDAPFSLVFYTVVLGQAWWIFSVYKVLTESYSTEKNFDDWYEDHPIGRE